MTPHDYELAVRAVIGLAGCAMALVAVIADGREARLETVPATWTTTSSQYVYPDNTSSRALNETSSAGRRLE